jgi:hypothetical protein
MISIPGPLDAGAVSSFHLAFGWMIPPLIYLFVWSAAAGAADWAP